MEQVARTGDVECLGASGARVDLARELSSGWRPAFLSSRRRSLCGATGAARRRCDAREVPHVLVRRNPRAVYPSKYLARRGGADSRSHAPTRSSGAGARARIGGLPKRVRMLLSYTLTSRLMNCREYLRKSECRIAVSISKSACVAQALLGFLCRAACTNAVRRKPRLR